jgi:hypothetical protein
MLQGWSIRMKAYRNSTSIWPIKIIVRKKYTNPLSFKKNYAFGGIRKSNNSILWKLAEYS